MLFAEGFDPRANLLQHLACPGHLLLMRSSKLRRIGKWPVQPFGYTREHRTTFRFGFTANCNYVGKQLTGFEDVKDRLRPNARDIDPDFLKRFHRQRVKCSRFESGALCVKKLAANPVEKRCGHLAARAVMDANEKEVFLHEQVLDQREDQSKRRLRVSQERHILTGRITRIVVPLLISLSASTRPPWSCATCLTIARPRPVPRMLSVLRALSTR
jgi:hypothetical protein